MKTFGIIVLGLLVLFFGGCSFWGIMFHLEGSEYVDQSTFAILIFGLVCLAASFWGLRKLLRTGGAPDQSDAEGNDQP